MIVVRDIEKIDRDKWLSFVKEHSKGNVFQSLEMYDVYFHTPNYFPMALAAEDEGIIKGVLLAVIMTNGPKLTKSLTARSIIIGGPVVLDDDVDVLSLLLSEYKHYLPRYVVYSEIRPVYDMVNCSSVLEKYGFIRVGHYNVLVPLKKPTEELYKRVKKERKRHIAQAERAGLIFSEVTGQDCIDSIVRLIEETYKRKHVPLSDPLLFYNTVRYMSQYVHLFAIYNDTKMIAGQVSLCFNGLVYAWYTGSDVNSLNLRPNDMLMWRFIQWANDNGYDLFDFGGGGEPGVPYGVRDYKMTFGAELFDYGRYLCLHKPLIYKLGKFILELFGKS